MSRGCERIQPDRIGFANVNEFRMELKEFQKKANEIIYIIDRKLEVEHNSSNTFVHVIEEIGELTNQLNKPDIGKENINKEELSDELADVFLLLTKLASCYEVDIEKAMENKIEKLKQRHNLM